MKERLQERGKWIVRIAALEQQSSRGGEQMNGRGQERDVVELSQVGDAFTANARLLACHSRPLPSICMASSSSLPPGVDLSAALSSYLSTKPRPSVQSFANASSAGELAHPDGRNTRRIYCPRDGCGCLILRAGDAQWREGIKGVVRLIACCGEVER